MSTNFEDLWDSPLKQEQREVIFDFIKRPIKSAFLMPAHGCKEIIYGILSGHFDHDTLLWLVDNDLNTALKMVATLRFLTADDVSRVTVKDLEKTSWEDIIGALLDFFYPDTCGVLDEPMLTWLFNVLLGEKPSERFMPQTVFAFNFYMPDRHRTYVNVDVPGLGDPMPDWSDEVADMKNLKEWLKRSRHLYNILSRLVPGEFDTSKFYLYRSTPGSHSLMCTCLFDVNVNDKIASEKRQFFLDNVNFKQELPRAHKPLVSLRASEGAAEAILNALEYVDRKTAGIRQYRERLSGSNA